MSSEIASYLEQGNEKLSQGNACEAIKYFDEALKLESDNIKAYFGKGSSFVELGEYENALECFNKCLEIDPTNLAYYAKSSVLLDLGDYNEALNSIDKSLDIEPKDVDALNLKSLILATSGKRSMAIGYLDDALKIDPNFFFALKNKGTILSELEKYRDAIKSLKLALKIEPDDDELLMELGWSLACEELYDEALEVYDRTLDINENNSLALYYKARIFWVMNKEENAMNYLDEVLKIEPEFVEAILLKAQIYRDLKKPETALKSYKKAIEIVPENPEAWIGMGNVLNDLGKKEDSLKAYEKFIHFVKKNKRSDLNLKSKRVSEYLNWVKSGKTITFSPKKEPQYWQWSTRPEYFLEDDGTERKCLEPSEDLNDPGDYWTCHKDTLAGDLILLYRVGKKNGVEYMDIKYLMMARSDAYPLDDLDVEDGWNYGCDYIPLFKFKNSLKLHEMKEYPYLEGWNALGAKFHRKVYKTEDRYWKHLEKLLIQKNPEYRTFLDNFDRDQIMADIGTEERLEAELEKKIHILKKFGYDLKVDSRQEWCIDGDGRMDLFCKDKKTGDCVVIELKITKANWNVFGQVSAYMGWAMDHKANGETVKGIVISRGYDKKFQSALKTNPNIDHIELVDVVSELGMKLK